MAFLEVSGLKKKFGSTEVLRDISFQLEQGKVLALIGSSGGGKTTLLRCLNFLETADEGTISLNGKVLFDGSQKGHISEKELRQRRLHFGLVFQSFNLFPQYTALENILLAPKLNKLSNEQELKTTALSLLKKVGLSDKGDNYPHELSGGQQQRTAIARALMMQPDILCFDEPTSALDPALTQEVLKVIRGLREEGRTMLIVTHEMSFVHAAADKVIFMSDGCIVEEGTPQQVLDHPTQEKTKLFLSLESEANKDEDSYGGNDEFAL